MTLPFAADTLIVIATIVLAFSVSSIVGAWAARRWPVVSGISLLIGLGLLAYVHLGVEGGLAPIDIPNAFINVAARIIG